MEEPLTDELLDELLSAPDPQTFANARNIGVRSMSDYLQQLLDEKSLVRAEVIRRAGLNETFGYQIFMGQRGASRNKVLQLAFAMKLTLKEADRLLQAAGVNELYCKNRRDAIIIFCLDRGYDLQKTDEELYRFGEDTIC
ncbi:transcriptional regulator [Enteroscipio rubneri]|uniref:Transcriptional regulator n=1 Tax=Enteroscipio rubneri TaxID=2070686 RepID=A0A2K2UDF3_9ACTN|nr:transcriptional regulator [Enteroscipio rubneri]PNV68356.1 transcriptional regulator [Enteroscipio rubneri]